MHSWGLIWGLITKLKTFLLSLTFTRVDSRNPHYWIWIGWLPVLPSLFSTSPWSVSLGSWCFSHFWFSSSTNKLLFSDFIANISTLWPISQPRLFNRRAEITDLALTKSFLHFYIFVFLKFYVHFKPSSFFISSNLQSSLLHKCFLFFFGGGWEEVQLIAKLMFLKST